MVTNELKWTVKMNFKIDIDWMRNQSINQTTLFYTILAVLQNSAIFFLAGNFISRLPALREIAEFQIRNCWVSQQFRTQQFRNCSTYTPPNMVYKLSEPWVKLLGLYLSVKFQTWTRQIVRTTISTHFQYIVLLVWPLPKLERFLFRSQFLRTRGYLIVK